MDADGSLITFKLNRETVRAHVAPHQSLIELLNGLGLNGARESCGQGLCGCCTVNVNGVAVSACLYLAVLVADGEVDTVEGLGRGGKLHPVQEAFIEYGAFQCGFCTPGMVMMTTQLLQTYPNPTEAQTRAYLSGNLCRCATYPEVIQAVNCAAIKCGRIALSEPAASA